MDTKHSSSTVTPTAGPGAVTPLPISPLAGQSSDSMAGRRAGILLDLERKGLMEGLIVMSGKRKAYARSMRIDVARDLDSAGYRVERIGFLGRTLCSAFGEPRGFRITWGD